MGRMSSETHLSSAGLTMNKTNGEDDSREVDGAVGTGGSMCAAGVVDGLSAESERCAG